MTKQTKEKNLQSAISKISHRLIDPQHPIGNQIELSVKSGQSEASTLCALWAARLFDKSKNPNDKYAIAATEFLEKGEQAAHVHDTLEEANRIIKILEPQILYSDNVNVSKLIALGKAYNVIGDTIATIDLLADYHDDENTPYNEDVAKILAKAYMDQEEYALVDYVLADVMAHNPNDEQAKSMLVKANELLKQQQQAVNNTQNFEL